MTQTILSGLLFEGLNDEVFVSFYLRELNLKVPDEFFQFNDFHFPIFEFVLDHFRAFLEKKVLGREFVDFL